jgi:hypothetical protein
MAGNGLPYCFVEIAESTGTHYVISAYGQEAVNLYDTAIKIANSKVSYHVTDCIGCKPKNHYMYRANLFSDTVSVIGTNESTPAPSQAICSEKM